MVDSLWDSVAVPAAVSAVVSGVVGLGVKHSGTRWLRIDVWTTNPALQRYYQGQGFRHVRTLANTDYPSGALFQRLAEHRSLPGLEEQDEPMLGQQP